MKILGKEYLSVRDVLNALNSLSEEEKELPLVIERGDWGPYPIGIYHSAKITIVKCNRQSNMWWEVLAEEEPDLFDDQMLHGAVLL